MSSGTDASVMTSSPTSACRRSTTLRFSVGARLTFVTQTSPSTVRTSVPALFVTATVYVLVPDWSVCRFHDAGVRRADGEPQLPTETCVHPLPFQAPVHDPTGSEPARADGPHLERLAPRGAPLPINPYIAGEREVKQDHPLRGSCRSALRGGRGHRADRAPDLGLAVVEVPRARHVQGAAVEEPAREGALMEADLVVVPGRDIDRPAVDRVITPSARAVRRREEDEVCVRP